MFASVTLVDIASHQPALLHAPFGRLAAILRTGAAERRVYPTGHPRRVYTHSHVSIVSANMLVGSKSLLSKAVSWILFEDGHILVARLRL